MTRVEKAEKMMIDAEVQEDTLMVKFADGMVCNVPINDLNRFGESLNLGGIELPNPYEIKIKKEDGGFATLPWDFIRPYEDADFEEKLQNQEEASLKGLGAYIKALRSERGWSQQEVADRADVHRLTIIRIENAETRPSFETLSKIANAFDCSLKDLMVTSSSDRSEHTTGADSEATSFNEFKPEGGESEVQNKLPIVTTLEGEEVGHIVGLTGDYNDARGTQVENILAPMNSSDTEQES